MRETDPSLSSVPGTPITSAVPPDAPAMSQSSFASSSSSIWSRSPPVPLETRPRSKASFSTADTSLSLSPSSTERSYTSFDELLATPGTRATTVASLDALKSVLQGVNTLPFVQYIASIGIQLIQYVIDAQITNDAFHNLAFRARDIILAVARACEGMTSIAARLEQDLHQLSATMNSILEFATEKTRRRSYKKLIRRSDDAAIVQALDMQLTHAFHIFEIQSNVSSRTMQHEMAQQLSTLSLSPPPAQPSFIPDIALRVPEGIYLIQNAETGWVLETEDLKKEGNGVHVHLSPSQSGRAPTQLWAIQKSPREGFAYDIRSVATGLVFDIFENSSRQGSKVVGHGYHAGGNQSWSFWATREAPTGEVLCTIKSIAHSSVLDASCPKSIVNCDNLHANHLGANGPHPSQEWSLISLTSPQLFPSPTAGLSVVIPRRPLLLQNVLSGGFATRSEAATTGPNVVLTTSMSPASLWTFNYVSVKERLQMDAFSIVSSSANPCTLDHWGRKYINCGRYMPGNQNHQWTPIARDGAFIFRNVQSGALLGVSRSKPNTVDTMPTSARDDLACHWRIVDPTTKDVVRILYDSALTVLPPDLAMSSRPGSSSPLPPPSPVIAPLTLASTPASSEMRLAMVQSFEQEHMAIRSMFDEGYKALVVAPRLISGWKDGRVKRMAILSDEAEFSERVHNFSPCDD